MPIVPVDRSESENSLSDGVTIVSTLTTIKHPLLECSLVNRYFHLKDRQELRVF